MRAPDGGGIETVVADDAEPERRRRSFEAIEERVKQLHGTIARRRRGAGHARASSRSRRTRPGGRLCADDRGRGTCSSSGRPPATRCASWTASRRAGQEFEEGGRTLVVNKIGASPLPGDTRPCAFSVGKS